MSDAEHIILEREVPTNREELHVLPRLLESVRSDCPVTDDQFFNLVIAMTEALNNAIVHGNQLDPTKLVRYTLRCLPDGIHCVIEDQGLGFVLEDVANPVAPENLLKMGGRGIFLIRALMTDVKTEMTDGGLRLESVCPRERRGGQEE